MTHDEIADLIIERKGACYVIDNETDKPIINCNECQAIIEGECVCVDMSDAEVLQWFKNWKKEHKRCQLQSE